VPDTGEECGDQAARAPCTKTSLEDLVTRHYEPGPRPAYVIGAGRAVPPNSYSQVEVAQALGYPEDKVLQYAEIIGVESRPFCWDLETQRQVVSADELAGEAAKAALASAGVDASEIDCIITGSSVPDYLMPSPSSRMLKHLGIGQVMALSLFGGCTNFIEALFTAKEFITSGAASTALVVSTEVPSTTAINTRTMLDSLFFGDGAGAFVLSTVPRQHSDFPVFEVLDTFCATRSEIEGEPAEVIMLPAITQRPAIKMFKSNPDVHPLAAAVRPEFEADYRLAHNARQAAGGAVPGMMEAFEQVTKGGAETPGAVVPHHGSKRVLDGLREQLPEGWTVVDNLRHRGNMSSVSIPMAFVEQFDTVIQAKTVVLSTVGNGLSFAGARLVPVS
jgi:3-oxoacyl-[acyl-carrier-protein] synthase III